MYLCKSTILSVVVDVVKTFTISFTGMPSELPTNATILLDFGDDDTISETFPSAFPHVIQHTYTAPANYIAKLTIQNLASSHGYEIEVGAETGLEKKNITSHNSLNNNIHISMFKGLPQGSHALHDAIW